LRAELVGSVEAPVNLDAAASRRRANLDAVDVRLEADDLEENVQETVAHHRRSSASPRRRPRRSSRKSAPSYRIETMIPFRFPPKPNSGLSAIFCSRATSRESMLIVSLRTSSSSFASVSNFSILLLL